MNIEKIIKKEQSKLNFTTIFLIVFPLILWGISYFYAYITITALMATVYGTVHIVVRLPKLSFLNMLYKAFQKADFQTFIAQQIDEKRELSRNNRNNNLSGQKINTVKYGVFRSTLNNYELAILRKIKRELKQQNNKETQKELNPFELDSIGSR